MRAWSKCERLKFARRNLTRSWRATWSYRFRDRSGYGLPHFSLDKDYSYLPLPYRAMTVQTNSIIWEFCSYCRGFVVMRCKLASRVNLLIISKVENTIHLIMAQIVSLRITSSELRGIEIVKHNIKYHTDYRALLIGDRAFGSPDWNQIFMVMAKYCFVNDYWENANDS